MKLEDLNRLSDRDLIAALRVYQKGLAGDEATYDLMVADTTAITNSIDGFETRVDTLDTKRAETAAARGMRDNDRVSMNDLARSQMKTARLKVGNDAGKLEAIGMNAYDTTATTPEAPGSAPFALIDFGILRHTINFRDSAMPDKRGKPAGMLGAEIWSKIDGPPPIPTTQWSPSTRRRRISQTTRCPTPEKPSGIASAGSQPQAKKAAGAKPPKQPSTANGRD